MHVNMQHSRVKRSAVEHGLPSSGFLRGRRLLVVRAAWIAMTVLVLGLFIVSVPVAYEHFHKVCQGPECGFWPLSPEDAMSLRDLGLSVDFYAAYNVALEVVEMLGFCAVGAFIFLRRSEELMPLLLSLALVLYGLNTAEALIAAYPDLWLPVAFVNCFGSICFFISFYLFPDGRFVPRWTFVPAAIWVIYQVPTYFLPHTPFDPNTWPYLLDASLWLGLLGTLIFAQIYRYVYVSNPIERQQTKWVVFGLTAAIVLAVGIVLAGAALLRIQPGQLGVLYTFVSRTVLYAAYLLVPLSIGIAILRYRLWDIDVLINRTLVYGALSASVVGIYALLVGGLGTLLPLSGDTVTSLIAAGLVAVLFAPLRVRLQRGVNHLMYGERDEPYMVLSRLGKRLEGTLAPEAALETVAEVVAQALKLPYAAIELRQDDGYKKVAEHGDPKDENTVLSLVHQGETVGRLVVAPRSPGEEFSHQDRNLLEDLAWQAGAAAHAALLTADLRRSRERLVTTREEERRRLRRDLHDGLGPTLGGLTLGLDAARITLAEDPGTTDELLAELKAQTREAVSDVRRLVHGLRPPALDDLGLVSAIRQQASKYGHLADVSAADTQGSAPRNELTFTVEAPIDLPSLPAAVEVACYRMAQEAITNVSRHSRARRCSISLSVDEIRNELVLEVADNGVGMPQRRRAGVGMSSMRERAEELGGTLTIESPEGGTRVIALLPLPERGLR
jgi:signal transduction histidine kinase